MRIITISGRAQSGKDTTASIIKRKLEHRGYKVLITHYADPLKFVCKNFFGWDGQKDERGRTLLQFVGTDVVRKQDQDFWVRFVVTLLRFFDGNWDFVVIPDARFPNEVEIPEKENFVTTKVCINRPKNDGNLTNSQLLHPSETSFSLIKHDFYINNDGDLVDLNNKVEDFITGYLLPDLNRTEQR